MPDSLQMVAVLDSGTLERELDRVSRLGADELRTCFAGTLRFMQEGNVVFSLEDVPLLGVLADFRGVVDEIERGADQASFVDFYGEFEVTLTREGAVGLKCTDSFRGTSFSTNRNAFVESFAQGARGFLADLVKALPIVKENASFPHIRDEIVAHE